MGDVIDRQHMCQRLIDYGYAGGWPWQWNEHADDIKACLRAATLDPDSKRASR